MYINMYANDDIRCNHVKYLSYNLSIIRFNTLIAYIFIYYIMPKIVSYINLYVM